MKLKSFAGMNCTIAQSLEVVGERWTLLVLRESFLGTRRFEDFHERLGIARNILTNRLERLVREGILERRLYRERPQRFEYRLTPKGLDLYEVILALKKWGDRWTTGEDGLPLLLRHQTCGRVFDVSPRCPHCGEEVRARAVTCERGAGAGPDELRRYAERVRERDARAPARV